MLKHLPILMVVLPLACAPLCLLLSRKDSYARGLACLVNITTLIFSWIVLNHVSNVGVMHYALGGWQPPWGIAFRVDSMNALIAFLFSLISSACLICMRDCFLYEARRKHTYPIYSSVLVGQAGFLGVVLTDDLFNIFVLLEIASLSSYVLTTTAGTKHSSLAAYRYLLMGTVGAIFLLLGIGYVYFLTGTLNLSDLAVRWAKLPASPATFAAMAFIAVGLFLKMALFPLHLWLVGVYTHAPTVITALFAGVGGKAAIYLFVRLFFSTFNIDGVQSPLLDMLDVIAVVAIAVGSYKALVQDNVKTMMAYSSIANMGYIMLALAWASQAGVAAGLIHIFNHAIVKSAFFLMLCCVVCCVGGNCSLKDLRGLGQRMPWTAAALTAGGVSLVGVPITAGFISKWYLVIAAIDVQAWIGLAAVVLGALFSVGYVWRVIEAMYFKTQDNGAVVAQFTAPQRTSITAWLLIGFAFYIGVNPSWLTEICFKIAKGMVM